MIGSFPPEFPETTWYNSEPLTWKQVRGQFVIVVFCAGWYEPSYDMLEAVRDLHELKLVTNYIVIGIHNQGSGEAFMKGEIGENHLTRYILSFAVHRAVIWPTLLLLAGVSGCTSFLFKQRRASYLSLTLLSITLLVADYLHFNQEGIYIPEWA